MPKAAAVEELAAQAAEPARARGLAELAPELAERGLLAPAEPAEPDPAHLPEWERAAARAVPAAAPAPAGTNLTGRAPSLRDLARA